MEGRYEVVGLGLNNRTELKGKRFDTIEKITSIGIDEIFIIMTIMKEGVCQGNILQRQNHSFHLIGNKMNGNNIQ